MDQSAAAPTGGETGRNMAAGGTCGSRRGRGRKTNKISATPMVERNVSLVFVVVFFFFCFVKWQKENFTHDF